MTLEPPTWTYTLLDVNHVNDVNLGSCLNGIISLLESKDFVETINCQFIAIKS